MNTHRIVDVIGVVFDLDKPQEVSCSGDLIKQRATARLVDDMKKVIELTLWDSKVSILDGAQRKCIGLRNVIVRQFNGKRTLVSTASTEAVLTLDSSSTRRIQNWYDEGGCEDEYDDVVDES